MREQLVLVSWAAGGAALLFAVARQAMELRQLRERLEQPSIPTPPDRPSGELRSPPRFSKLYKSESPKLLARLQGIPGAGALGAAAVLGLVALGLGLTGSQSGSAKTPPPPAQVAAAQPANVDSLTATITRLRDSLRLASASPAPVKPAPIAAKPQPHAPAARPAAAVPPPPVMDPSLAATSKP
jgi:hypothetical protein